MLDEMRSNVSVTIIWPTKSAYWRDPRVQSLINQRKMKKMPVSPETDDNNIIRLVGGRYQAENLFKAKAGYTVASSSIVSRGEGLDTGVPACCAVEFGLELCCQALSPAHVNLSDSPQLVLSCEHQWWHSSEPGLPSVRREIRLRG